MARRFPPPWRTQRMPGGYVVRDAHGQATDLRDLLLFCTDRRLCNDGRCLACRNTDRSLLIWPVDRCCLPTRPVPRLTRLRRPGLGGLSAAFFLLSLMKTAR
jgi:hypothetical protein